MWISFRELSGKSAGTVRVERADRSKHSAGGVGRYRRPPKAVESLETVAELEAPSADSAGSQDAPRLVEGAVTRQAAPVHQSSARCKPRSGAVHPFRGSTPWIELEEPPLSPESFSTGFPTAKRPASTPAFSLKGQQDLSILRCLQGKIKRI